MCRYRTSRDASPPIAAILFILATVCPSEEKIARWLWPVMTLCFLAALAMALVVLIASVACKVTRSWPLRLAAATFLLGLGPLALVYYEYQLDYVAVAMDGTKASGPLWDALFWPALPSAAAVLASVIFLIRRMRTGFLLLPPANEDRLLPQRPL